MQWAVIETLEREVRAMLGLDNPDEDPPDDFGFFHPWDVVHRCWQGRRLGFLPSVGGVLDQDADLWHDMNMMDWLYSAIYDELAPQASRGNSGLDMFEQRPELGVDSGKLF